MRCLQVALNGNADVNNVSETGMPVFLLACEQAQDCEGMCLSILDRGADPNATNQVCQHCIIDKWTPKLIECVLQEYLRSCIFEVYVYIFAHTYTNSRLLMGRVFALLILCV